MNKYFNTVTNERGDALPNYRVQVVDSTGAIVSIYEDESETPFRDSSGNVRNYAEADSAGFVEFYWNPAMGQTLQVLDRTGSLLRPIVDFASIAASAAVSAGDAVAAKEDALAAASDAETAKLAAVDAQTASESAKDGAEDALLLAQAAQASAEAAEAATEARVALIEEVAGAAVYPAWAELSAVVGMVADDTAVIFEDAGTHTDPVTAATVDNSGLYIYRDPTGWERFADASEAARQAAIVTDAVAEVTPIVPLTVSNTDAQFSRQQTAAALDAPGTLTPTAGSGTVVTDSTPISDACQTLLVDVIAAAEGTIYVYSHSKSGNDFTVLDSATIYVPTAGRQNFMVALDMPAGCYLSFSAPGVTQTMTGGASVPVYSGGSIASPNYTDATTGTANRFAINLTAYSGVTRVDTFAGKVANTIPYGSLKTVGTTDFSSPLDGPTDKYYRVFNQPFANGGYIKSVTLFMDEAESPTIYSYSFTGTTTRTWTPSASKNLGDLEAGLNSNVPVGIVIPPGGHVGAYAKGIALQTGQWSVGVWLGDSPIFTNTQAPGGNKLLLAWEIVEFEKGSFDLLRSVLAEETQETTTASATGALLPIHPDLLETRSRIYAGFQGQSNIVGAPSATAATHATPYQEHGLLTFNSSSNTSVLVDAIPANTTDDGDGREFPGLGGGTYLRQRLMREGGQTNGDGVRPMIVGHSGDGGTAINRHVKGSVVAGEKFYVTSQAQLTAAEASAGAEGFFHIGQVYWQGTGDANAGTTRASYKASLASIGNDYDSDSRVIAPDGFDIRRTAVMQLASDGTSAAWEIAMAQFEACRDTETLCMACPPYMLDYEDEFHAAPASSRIAGAYFMRALSTGRKFEPLQVVDSKADGTAIRLLYNRPNLLLDTDTLPKQQGYGFRVFNASDAEVTGFTVSVDGNTVTLEVGSSVTGYSWNYGYVTAVGKGDYVGGAGNLRDRAGDSDKFDGQPLHNWAVFQEGSL